MASSVRREGRVVVLRRRSSVAPLVLVVIGLIASPHARADWPNFRGPRHDGISDEKGLKTTWTKPPPLVWDRNLGSAYSSLACVGDRIYTCGTKDQRQIVYCLDAATAKTVWQTPFAPAFNNSFGSGPRATPTVHDGRVYILGGHGAFVCLSADDGRELWRRSFHNEPTWGYSGSVLIEGDLAIVSGGGDDGALVALDRKTGRPVWKCGDDPTGYGTPYPFTFDDKRYVVGFMGDSAIVAEVAAGRQVLRIPWETSYNVNASSPIYHDGHLFLSSGYATGCALFKLGHDGERLSASEVWRSDVLRNKFQSCILHNGYLYGSDEKAFKCVEFLTGRPQWRRERMKHGTVLLADNHLLLLTEKGKLQIAPVSPESFSPTTTADVLTGRCWTVPVIHRGRLYARNLQRLACFDLE